MKSYPFDSQIIGYEADGAPIYDRAADSAVLANWMKHYFSDGVFIDQNTQSLGFQVLEASSGLEITVGAGACEIQGRFAYEDNVTTLTLSEANTSYDRIDTVALRLNLENDVRNIQLIVIPGTPATSPVAPTLTRNASIYDLGIANIHIAKNTKAIKQSMITDTRLDSTRCGVVCVPMQVMDSQSLYDQIQNDLNNFRSDYEKSFDQWSAAQRNNFDTWFANVQSTLDESVAGNLYNLILENGIQTYTHTKNGDVHELEFSGGMDRNIRFVATAKFNQGDTFSINGITVDAIISDGTPLYDEYFVAGSVVLCFFNSNTNVLSFIGMRQPTPENIGAVNKTGDTMTGALVMKANIKHVSTDECPSSEYYNTEDSNFAAKVQFEMVEGKRRFIFVQSAEDMDHVDEAYHYKEHYTLPYVDHGLTEEKYYEIVTQKNLANMIYPVGSIYLSVNSVSPASLFGGTWTQLKNRFLLGAGSSYSNGATGGAATVKLTIDQMPEHRHTLREVSSNPNTEFSSYIATSDDSEDAYDSPSEGVKRYTTYVGGGEAHNNMPPYLVVYMWKRVG